jgi:hypothetical protein
LTMTDPDLDGLARHDANGAGLISIVSGHTL